MAAATALASGSCGLTDGSQLGDWHLPNIKEFQSLIDFSQTQPALPAGHPFLDVQGSYESPFFGYYWSSTSLDVYAAWIMFLPFGELRQLFKNFQQIWVIWPVRGGN